MSENRTEQIAFRMTTDERCMLTHYADKSHMSVSEYLRALALMGMVIRKEYTYEEGEDIEIGLHHCQAKEGEE